MDRKYFAVIIVSAVVCLFGGSFASGESGVKIWTEPLTLPTFEPARPDSNPMFYKGDGYQDDRRSQRQDVQRGVFRERICQAVIFAGIGRAAVHGAGQDE